MTSHDGISLPTKPDVERKRELAHLGQEIDEIRLRLRQTIVEQSVEIGKRLIAAKRLCRHGEWLPWLAERGMSERSSQNYMKMANKVIELEKSNPKRVSDLLKLSYREALKAIQEPADRPATASPRRQLAGPPVSTFEIEADQRRVLEGREVPPVFLGDEPIDMADLGPEARRQLEQASAAPAEPDAAAIPPEVEAKLVARYDGNPWADEHLARAHSFWAWLSTAPMDRIVSEMLWMIGIARAKEMADMLHREAGKALEAAGDARDAAEPSGDAPQAPQAEQEANERPARPKAKPGAPAGKVTNPGLGEAIKLQAVLGLVQDYLGDSMGDARVKALARKAGIGEDTLKGFLAGTVKPHAKTLEKIEKALDR